MPRDRKEERKGPSRELFWKSERVCVARMVAAGILCCWSTWYTAVVVSRLWPGHQGPLELC